MMQQIICNGTEVVYEGYGWREHYVFRTHEEAYQVYLEMMAEAEELEEIAADMRDFMEEFPD